MRKWWLHHDYAFSVGFNYLCICRVERYIPLISIERMIYLSLQVRMTQCDFMTSLMLSEFTFMRKKQILVLIVQKTGLVIGNETHQKNIMSLVIKIS